MIQAVEDIKESALPVLDKNMLTMWLSNNDAGEWFLFAEVPTVEQGRLIWTQIAAYRGCDLSEFQIRKDGEPVYTGNYITDEC